MEAFPQTLPFRYRKLLIVLLAVIELVALVVLLIVLLIAALIIVLVLILVLITHDFFFLSEQFCISACAPFYFLLRIF